MGVKKKPEPEQPVGQPALNLEVEIKDGHVYAVKKPNHWTLPDSVVFWVFDYFKGCPESLLEADDQEGTECKQTKWTGPQVKGQEEVVIRFYIKEGVVFRVLMPPGTVIEVKTYPKKGGEPEVRRLKRKI